MQLGSSYIYKNSGQKRRLVEQQDTFQYIPLLQNLEWVLQNEDVYKKVYVTNQKNIVTLDSGQLCILFPIIISHPVFPVSYSLDNFLQNLYKINASGLLKKQCVCVCVGGGGNLCMPLGKKVHSFQFLLHCVSVPLNA